MSEKRLSIVNKTRDTSVSIIHPNGRYPSTLEINAEDHFGEATVYLTKKEVIEFRSYLNSIDIDNVAGG